MPAKRNVTKETSKVIFLYTRGHGRIKLFQTSRGWETTLAPGLQDDNKNTYQANTFFSHKIFAPTIAETSRRRTSIAELS